MEMGAWSVRGASAGVPLKRVEIKYRKIRLQSVQADRPGVRTP
jgi:hypothetical protein